MRTSRRLGTFLHILPLLLLCASAHAQVGQRTFTTTVVANDVGIGNIGSGIQYHQLIWNTVGTVTTCSVKLQSSVDNITYIDLITSQTCTAPGASTIVNSVVNYIKIEVTVKSGTGSVVVHWNGFNTNPTGGGGGTVTSIAATSPIVVTPNPITGAGTVSCPTCSTAAIGGVNPQLEFNNAGVFGGVLGSAVTAATGALTLTAPTDVITPFTVNSHSITQSATIVDYNNQAVAGPSKGLISYRGRGVGSFTAGGQHALLSMQQDDTTDFVRVVTQTFNAGNLDEAFEEGFEGTSWYMQTQNDLATIFSLITEDGSTNNFGIEISTTGPISLAPGANQNINLVPITPGFATVFGQTVAGVTGITEWEGAVSGGARISVADVAGTPEPILLPLTTGAAGQFLQTDGGSPQQTSWGTPVGLISGLTAGFIPFATSATALADSLCDQAITTANTFNCSDTAGAHFVALSTGTAPPAITVGTAGVQGGAEGTTPTGFGTGADWLWENAALHCMDLINNNVDVGCVSTTTTLSTSVNCSSTASPAVCTTAPAGAVVVAAAATTVVVNTSAVTTNSEIFVVDSPYLSTRLSVTCNATIAIPTVTAISAGVSFTITIPVAPITNPACYDYVIVN